MQGTIIDERYEVLDFLGRGGMGQVYLARDGVLSREVALKVLKPQYAESAEFVERFRREAKNAAALSHANIVSVYDRGEGKDGTPYMAMEYVDGGTLADRLEKEGPLDALEAAGIAAQVAAALEEAHRYDMVHRDIKPHNVFLVDGVTTPLKAGTGGIAPGGVKVGDFGIARAAAETAMTETSLILGTVRYVSPEQATGGQVGPASDLYSLGVVLFEMLTGRVPFDAENPIAVAMKHVSEMPPSPREVNPGVPAGLDALTRRLLSKDPHKRYASAAELADDLERASRGLSPVGVKVEKDTEVLSRRELLPPGEETRPARPERASGVWGAVARAGGVVGLLAVLLAAGAASLVFAAGSTDDLYQTLGLQGSQEVERVAVPMMAVPGGAAPDRPAGISPPDARVGVPGVVGEEQEAAENRLREADLEVEVRRAESSEAETGRVVAQEPRADTRVQRGSVVTVTVGDGPATADVPDLTGLSVAEAEAALTDAGLSLGTRDRARSATMPEGLILYQGVQAGTEVDVNTPVAVTISSGPPPQPEPVEPEPVEPEPVEPEPVEPEPVEPESVAPTPAPEEPVTPESVEPEPVTPEPQGQEEPADGRQEEPSGDAQPGDAEPEGAQPEGAQPEVPQQPVPETPVPETPVPETPRSDPRPADEDGGGIVDPLRPEDVMPEFFGEE